MRSGILHRCRWRRLLYGATGGIDCDDNNASIHPGAVDVCDGVDNNCDGRIDENSPTWYRDGDGDGFGDPNNTVKNCTKPLGYVSNHDDCNDSNANINICPGGTMCVAGACK